jgi:glucuronoarabinoxylan endo-1,4-beta-xylanase
VSARILVGSWFSVLLGALALGCGSPSHHAEIIDSQTNWLKACQIDSQCEPTLSCVCGVCTKSCDDDSTCTNTKPLKGMSCVQSDDPAVVAQCSGARPSQPGLCMPRCSDTGCGDRQMCVAGACTPVPTADTHVAIDTHVTHQTLAGFGAAVAYDESEITSHPEKAALEKTLFADLGLDVLRLRDRYGHTGDDDLTATRDLIAAASASLGRTPLLLLTSWSPPATLKANAAVNCSGNSETCTLVKNSSGGFDYASFATYWRSSLDAYAAVGISPDYIGIQNNPNWLPTAAQVGEACIFLPSEGTTTVTANGKNVTVSYPGYAEAQTATLKALRGFSPLPKVLAPETSDFASVQSYLAALDPSSLDAVAHHLYGVDPDNVDLTALGAVDAILPDKPVFQTEMQADGIGTALLIHYTTTVENASAYLQTTLTSSATGPATNFDALVGVTATDYTIRQPYYAMRHYALNTDPGWTRVDANSTSSTMLASAWVSPAADALTVVLVNAGTADQTAELDFVNGGRLPHSAVSRTVFDGVERGAVLGSLSDDAVVTIPARSIVTVAFSN